MNAWNRVSNIALRLLLRAVRRESARLREQNEALIRAANSYRAAWRRALILTRPVQQAHRSKTA